MGWIPGRPWEDLLDPSCHHFSGLRRDFGSSQGRGFAGVKASFQGNQWSGGRPAVICKSLVFSAEVSCCLQKNKTSEGLTSLHSKMGKKKKNQQKAVKLGLSPHSLQQRKPLALKASSKAPFAEQGCQSQGFVLLFQDPDQNSPKTKSFSQTSVAGFFIAVLFSI